MFSGLVLAGITGSSHDFTDNLKGLKGDVGTGTAIDESWNAREEICRVCHVPHDHGKVSQRYLSGLLWNHNLSTATYTMYDSTWSSTLTGTQSSQPDGTAKLCLGCHDGTVAIDAFDKYAGGTVWFDDTAAGYDGAYVVPAFADGANRDLRGTHPISIEYPAGEIGDGINFTDPAVATWASGDTVASTLDNNKVQCSTCHDVHNQESVDGTHILRAAQTVATGGVASGLCLTCHVK
jgi:hypothetical protein